MNKYWYLMLISVPIAFSLKDCCYTERECYVPNLKMYIKMERAFSDVKMSFSADGRYNNGDCIRYKNHPEWPDLELYISPPDTIYAINKYNGIVEIKSKHFKIVSVDYMAEDVPHVEHGDNGTSYTLPFTLAYSDSSFMDRSCYHIITNDRSDGVAVFDSNGQVVLDYY